MAKTRVLGLVLAGGEGKRLWPLTADRAKAAVPFGGCFRLVDIALSSMINAGYRRIFVLTQYKSHSLNRHITTAWRMSHLLDAAVTPVPAQQRLGPRWFTGSADAVYQSLNLLYDDGPDYVIVFGSNHIYRLDPSQVIEDHIASGADVTMAGVRVSLARAARAGVIQTHDGSTITGYQNRPADPPAAPDDPSVAFRSMGIYVFTTQALIQALQTDAADESSVHDMGRSVIPYFVDLRTAHLYDLARNDVPGATDHDRSYWRDISTLDDYHESHMDLAAAHPFFNLYNDDWPILTLPGSIAPAKFGEYGTALDSIVNGGTIITGSTVQQSVVSYNVRVQPGSRVERSVLLPGVRIGRDAVVRNAILDKNVVVADGATVGVNPPKDHRLLAVSEGGITVIGKGRVVVR